MNVLLQFLNFICILEAPIKLKKNTYNAQTPSQTKYIRNPRNGAQVLLFLEIFPGDSPTATDEKLGNIVMKVRICLILNLM